MLRLVPSMIVCLCLAACAPAPQPEAAAAPAPQGITSGDGASDFGAVSSIQPVTMLSDLERSTDWPPAKVVSGTASISCETDYATHGNGVPLANLEFFSVLDAMAQCQQAGVVRLHYRGKVAGDFTTLVDRIGEMATRIGIGKRILDIDSSGGHVEDAIVAGDAMADAGWTLWVREDAVCHSACVLLLAAGDTRLVSGKVGIHRIMRLESTATSRAELNRELRDVHAQIESYLARNGAARAIADLMMTVPNRSLRLLAMDELAEYGLVGINAAQDDLERIRLARECGQDVVRRRDAFGRAYESECALASLDVEGKHACGLVLQERLGFPDAACPSATPIGQFQ